MVYTLRKSFRMAPPLEPGFWKEISGAFAKLIDVFVKPLRVVSDAIAIRTEVLLRRKPRVYVTFQPVTSYWCLAHEGDKRVMQVGFTADFAHDDPEQNVLVIEAYPKGTRTRYPLAEKLSIRPSELVTQRFNLMAVPVVGEEGKNWKGRVVLVDQWKRRYKTDEPEGRLGGHHRDSACEERRGRKPVA